MNDAVRPRSLAATVILHRRSPGLEVFWVRRSPALAFLGGFHAFPGGRVAKEDRAIPVRGAADEESAALVTGAARETFEETGVLLARGARRVPADAREAARRMLLEDERANAGRFATFLAAHDLVLEAADFVPAGRWVSPPFSPGGFDTQFFLCELPDGESPVVWPGELASGEWIAPHAGLEAWRQDRALLAAPSLAALRTLDREPDAPVGEWGGTLSRAPEARRGPVPRIEVHPGFVLFPVRTPTLAPATHTNCLVIGGPEVLIVDPGSPYEDEQEKLDAALDLLLAEGGGRRVHGVLITHHHADHWGGAARLAKRLGVPILAHAWTAPKVGADRALEGGETIVLAPGLVGPALSVADRPWRIDVLFTPGHTPGHLALFDPQSGTIVAGDLVSGLSTVIVDPPEGDMALYVDSIRRLKALDSNLILPGHGPPIGGPAERLAFYLEHRAWREAKILGTLEDGPLDLSAIVVRAYDDTPVAMHGPASRSALAHLIKLECEGRVENTGETRWSIRRP